MVMVLLDKLNKDIVVSMKAKSDDLTTLRMLKASLIKESQKGTKHDLSEAEELVVVTREIKSREDSLQVYADLNQTDKVNQLNTEIAILKRYQPKQLSPSELSTIVDELIMTSEDQTMKAMGVIVKQVKDTYPGQVDGKTLANLVKEKLMALKG